MLPPNATHHYAITSKGFIMPDHEPIQGQGERDARVKLVDSVFLTLIARGAIIIATLVALPLAGWMLNRAVDAVDRLSAKVDALREQSLDISGTVKLIQQSQDTQSRAIADHEARVRLLEHDPDRLRPR
jgi:hypothetical protein